MQRKSSLHLLNSQFRGLDDCRLCTLIPLSHESYACQYCVARFMTSKLRKVNICSLYNIWTLHNTIEVFFDTDLLIILVYFFNKI